MNKDSRPLSRSVWSRIDVKSWAITEFTLRQYQTRKSTWAIGTIGILLVTLVLLFYVKGQTMIIDSVDQDGDSYDYDGDGYADLFNSVPDAVASIANYLKKHGWKRDGVILKSVELNKVNKIYKLPSNSNKFIPLKYTEGYEERYIIQEGDSLSSIAMENNLELHNLMSINNIKDKNFIKAGQIIMLSKPKDLYFIGDDNFIAITKYNRSHFYAKAVYDLSLEFK